jgi:hypothetical protein
MTYSDELKIERYKIIKDRQKYFTELAKNAYDLYLKTFIYIVTGAMALLSFKEKINVQGKVLEKVMKILILLIYVVGFAAIFQILFCLVRWYALKSEEKEFVHTFKKEWWAFIYEGIYVTIILTSMAIIYCNRSYLNEFI